MSPPAWRELLLRGIRPEGDVTPNENPPTEPMTVGPDQGGGDVQGMMIAEPEVGELGMNPPAILTPSPWAGWPASWWPPYWNGGGGGGWGQGQLTDTAWACLDLNASVLASMPPYLVGAGPSLDASWLTNPDPDLYGSWDEFAKGVFWDFMLGEAFILATASYASGWPARFHHVAPWLVNVEMDAGRRRYSIGAQDVTDDLLHLRYQSRTDDAHGHGPLEAGAGRLVLESLLTRYVTGYARAGGNPDSIITHPDQLTATQSAELQNQWVQARLASAGAPAVLSGGVEWHATQASPVESGSAELMTRTQARIAILLGVPPFLVGLPSGGDSMTYANVSSLFDFHWRASLRPKAQAAMRALSAFALPRGVGVELNRDAYVQAGPLERAQTWAALHAIEDPDGTRAVTAAEVRLVERTDQAGAGGLSIPTEAEVTGGD